MKKFTKGLLAGLMAVTLLANVAMAPVPAKQDEDYIVQVLKSIPSAVEISTLLKDMGTEYNKGYLNDHKRASDYNSNYKKAFNLGIYSTDLGIAHIYGKTQDGLQYLNAVQMLAEGLSVEQFFEYETIKELAESTDNLDELLQLTQRNFEDVNDHLKKQKREHLSILLLTGGWLEVTNLMCKAYADAGAGSEKGQELMEKIGEQKIVLEQIMQVLDVYKSRPEFPALFADMKKLDAAYAAVEIEVIPGKTETVEVDGVLTFVSNDEMNISIDAGTVAKIADLTAMIRQKAIM